MIKRFSDFAKERTFLDGDKLKIKEVLNREIEVINFRIIESKYGSNNSGKCLNLQFIFKDDNKHYILFTGSEVLISQIEQYQDQIPFAATIINIDKFYTFS